MALKVHKDMILSNKKILGNLKGLYYYWKNNKDYTIEEKNSLFIHFYNTLQLMVPVISSTFASIESFFRYVGKNSIGTVIIDEAGQAVPHSALGLLWRSSKAIIVGDPLQVEPIYSVERVILELLAKECDIDEKYADNTLSVQTFADNVNEFNGNIHNNIVGCPLVVHRRCLSPMFDISNCISYGNRMFNETDSDSNIKTVLQDSVWIDVKGNEKTNQGHYIQEQGNYIVDMLKKAVDCYNNIWDEEQKNIFIISPFTTVVEGLIEIIYSNYKIQIEEYNKNKKDIDKKEIKKILKNMVGTVHKFQGRDAKEVFLVLGCDKTSIGAINWASAKANILNVACTRAKNKFAIVGDVDLWGSQDYYKEAKGMLGYITYNNLLDKVRMD